MKTEVDLYKLVAVISEDSALQMITAGMVERHVMHGILKEYKELNKDSYNFTLNAFNDGNNCFEDYIYIESFSKFKFSHSHTMSENADFMGLLSKEEKDNRLSLFKRAFQRVYDLHLKFGIIHHKSKILLQMLNEKNIE